MLAEPDGIHSFDMVWDCSYKCFECSKNCSYKLASALCGCCIAFYWGFEFGCLAFNCIWCYSPALRQYSIIMGNLQKYCGITINCCCAPFFEVCGLWFSRITVYNKTWVSVILYFTIQHIWNSWGSWWRFCDSFERLFSLYSIRYKYVFIYLSYWYLFVIILKFYNVFYLHHYCSILSINCFIY